MQIDPTYKDEDAPKPRMVLAAGRLASSNGLKLTVIEQKDGKDAEIELIPEGSRDQRIVDFGLSTDGKLAYATMCRLQDSRATPARQKSPAPCTNFSLRFWQVDTKRELEFFGETYDRLPVVAVASSDGNFLVAAQGKDDGVVKISRAPIPGDSNFQSLQTVLTVEMPAPLKNLIAVKDFDALISVSGAGVVTSWRMKTDGGIEKTLLEGFPIDLAVSSSGTLATIGAHGVVVQPDRGQRAVLPRPSLAPGRARDFPAIALAPDGSQVAVVQDPMVRLWSADLTRRLFSQSLGGGRYSPSVALDSHLR